MNDLDVRRIRLKIGISQKELAEKKTWCALEDRTELGEEWWYYLKLTTQNYVHCYRAVH